MNKRIVRSKF